jgi:hypothetical protein
MLFNLVILLFVVTFLLVLNYIKVDKNVVNTNNIQNNTKNKYNNVHINYDDITPPTYIDVKNKLGTYDDDFKITNSNINIKNPSQEDIIYDSYKQFNQPSDALIHNPFVPTQIDYTNREIQDVYDQLINDPKKYEQPKTIKKFNDIYNEPIKHFNGTSNDSNSINGTAHSLLRSLNGGFKGEHILSNVMWEYEEDNDGMSYDPTLSTLMTI